MRINRKFTVRFAKLALLGLALATVQRFYAQNLTEVSGQIKEAVNEDPKRSEPPTAVWLTPLRPGRAPVPAGSHGFTLLQKDKRFTPHLLIIPVGSVVHFPNRDPFFHNVFSLFDGRRFDLGLYEAGSSKDVTFNREGVSYVFCNIHSEMSAVIIALATPFYTQPNLDGRFRIRDVPADDYMLHVWVEGEDQAVLDSLKRKVHISGTHLDLGSIILPKRPQVPNSHENKYGQSYDNPEPAAY
ncbi:Copper binding protein, plastocyanin/azurin family [Acidisarcina polymorpha]|uniref:Copper binding protein, plastocyanin/azurin family n=1 Tax=Acidisarcina polymorpha TaxID=2211140 RepID=A0A2Z5FUE7_9BACT|nr:hypothetical protein [Acidisarcina polymorpha]AXC10352.1 Copper binding protein, plastocyanin/azurin family [Acidisarcina polymorpha]